MPVHFRKQMRIGPLMLNFGNKGFSSWGIKIWKWSWNSRTKRQSVDLPGPISWRSK